MIPLTESFVTLMTGLIYAIDLFLVIGFGYAAYYLWQDRRHLLSDEMFGTMLFPVRPAGGVVFIPVILYGLRELQLSLYALSHPVARIAIGTFLVASFSAGMFAIKVKRLRAYALVEAAFATWVCVQTLWGLGDTVPIERVASLIAAAYLFIRAADNFKKDLDERRKEASKEKPAT